jgi:hypothetical protein
MSSVLTELHPPLLADLVPADVPNSYARRDLGAVPDARLCELVAELIARPKVAQADSFVLHAPLELLARTALLQMVEPQARELARQRIVWLGATYAAAGEEVGPPHRRSYNDPETAVDHLASALWAGDLDEAGDAASWVAATVSPVDISRALAEAVLPRLSAAGHGSIFLYLLPRIAPRSATAAGMVRGLVRELARQPDWNVTWHRLRQRSGKSSGDLVERLLRPPSPGDPGSNFIYPTMSLVDRSGLAAEVLDRPTQSLDIRQARQDLLRVAAWSMVQDDPDHAPYGWSHCLTMPQAALGVHGVAGIPESGADPEHAIAVAATYVLGFRSTLGRVTLDPGWVPDPPSASDPLDSLAESPDEAASGVWHAPESAIPAIIARLATHAAIHHDAHLAKYTLACLDATNADPAAGRLFLSAAAYLGAWWTQRPADDDPLSA